MKKLFFLLSFISFFATAQRNIEVDDFTRRNTFSQRTVFGLNWMNDGKFYSALSDNKIIRYDVTTGQPVETILDGAQLGPAITISRYEFSNDESRLLLLTEYQSIYRRSFTAEYYIYDIASRSLRKLSGNGRQSYATFSPAGDKVAFVRNNNLFVVDATTYDEKQLSDDGKFNHIINGSTDWVYEEEFGFVKAFFWSPDGSKLAYYRFDESGVPEYNMQVWNEGELYPEDYRFKYPKAGEKNSTVEIWIHDLATNKRVKADVGNDSDFYIPRVTWTADANTLSIRKMNRLQNRMDLLHTDARTGESRTVITEESDTYVDVEVIDDLTYLADGKTFLMPSERSGYKHLYLYDINGKLIRQITSGEQEVIDFLGVDEKSNQVFYTSTEISPLEKHFYSIGLNGKKKTRLSAEAGTHHINMSDDFQFYIATHTDATRPALVRLYRTKGNALIKVLQDNQSLINAIKDYGFAAKEFFTFSGADGTLLNGYMLKPAGFDESKKYPVLVYQYSGPGSQNVSNAFGGSHFYFHQMLTQQGYVVVVVDTRGTGRRGEHFKKLTYKQLGKYELEDLLATGTYLASLPYVDGERLGVWGWSYGGYMSSLVMTKGEGRYKLGIAVAPVTNWRYYDTIYTERYMQTPQLNASGYDDNSPVFFAKGLQGHFLLIHGTGDDNVHFQNSVALQNALVSAGKQFESFYYPDKNHGIPGGGTRHHLYTMMLNFIKSNL